MPLVRPLACFFYTVSLNHITTVLSSARRKLDNTSHSKYTLYINEEGQEKKEAPGSSVGRALDSKGRVQGSFFFIEFLSHTTKKLSLVRRG